MYLFDRKPLQSYQLNVVRSLKQRYINDHSKLSVYAALYLLICFTFKVFKTINYKKFNFRTKKLVSINIIKKICHILYIFVGEPFPDSEDSSLDSPLHCPGPWKMLCHGLIWIRDKRTFSAKLVFFNQVPLSKQIIPLQCIRYYSLKACEFFY